MRASHPAVPPLHGALSAAAVMAAVGALAVASRQPLLTLGGMKATGATVMDIAIGVAIVTALGEVARRLHPHHEASREQERRPDNYRMP